MWTTTKCSQYKIRNISCVYLVNKYVWVLFILHMFNFKLNVGVKFVKATLSLHLINVEYGNSSLWDCLKNKKIKWVWKNKVNTISQGSGLNSFTVIFRATVLNGFWSAELETF